MIAMPSQIPVPVPASVHGLKGRAIPEHVREAMDVAEFYATQITERREPLTPARLAVALGEIAFSNKVTAAYNPGLIVRIGGAQ